MFVILLLVVCFSGCGADLKLIRTSPNHNITSATGSSSSFVYLLKKESALNIEIQVSPYPIRVFLVLLPLCIKQVKDVNVIDSRNSLKYNCICKSFK